MKTLTSLKQKGTLLILLATVCWSASAQKLPGSQKNSVYAPANVKTDGKANEWDNKMEAYNSSTSVSYTMANDADKLYLTIQATNMTAINKILSGSVTLTIKSPDKAHEPVALTYVIVPAAGRAGIVQKMRDPATKMDSVLTPINEQIGKSMKEIGIKGVKDINDTLISVYNEYGIKAGVQFDDKKVLTCEVAIPLKYISQLINAGTFKYNVMLNGMKMSEVKIVVNGVSSGDAGAPRVMNIVSKMTVGSDGGGFQDMFNPTDFSGTYTLAKK